MKMKHLVNEEVNYKVGKTVNGTPIAYIDPNTSEDTFRFRDILKKYGAKWDSYAKRWFWWLSKNAQETEEILTNKVNPAIDAITKIEMVKGMGERRDSSKIQENLAKIVRELDVFLNAPVAETNGSNSAEDIKNKIASFKDKLVNITSSEEFKRVLGPIVKFKQALGHTYSFGNAILIWLQDPEATMVKSRTRWAKVNRVVKDGAPAIMLYSPYGLQPFTPEEKRVITAEFLKVCGVKSVKELNPGQKEKLSVKLTGGNPKGFKLTPSFYDHRYTEPMMGKEDLAPSANTENVEWFDDKSPASEKTIALYDSAIKSIEEVGITVVYTNDLNGARGVSTSGKIEVLRNTPKNIGDFNTLVHEFSHELLHQRYLKDKSNNDFGSFFIGTKQGRAQVEQQAEVSAWIICQYYGYEMQTSINYMGCWGMDNKNAARVFDTVASVASKIIELVSKNINMIKEAIEINESAINGEDIANMVGLGNLYRKSKQMEMQNTIGINEEDIRKMVREALEEYIEPRVVNINHEKLKKYVDDNKGEQFQEWYNTQTKTNDEVNNYTHFAVNKHTGLIVNGWDYSGYDADELRQFKKDYFIVDLEDNDFNPRDYKILTRQGCLKQGINPDDMQNYWSNRGDVPLKDEIK